MATVAPNSSGFYGNAPGIAPPPPRQGLVPYQNIFAAANANWARQIANSLPNVQAAAAARANTYNVIDSGLKNLRGILSASLNRKKSQAEKDRERALLAMKGSLAGRGLLFSGETGYQEGLNQENYSNTLGDLMDAFNTALLNGEQSAALNKINADSAYQQALADAYNYVSQNPSQFNY